jgi:hypothetical protein
MPRRSSFLKIQWNQKGCMGAIEVVWKGCMRGTEEVHESVMTGIW